MFGGVDPAKAIMDYVHIFSSSRASRRRQLLFKYFFIYTTSIDYDPKNEKTIEFFKIVQDKLLWAISNVWLS